MANSKNKFIYVFLVVLAMTSYIYGFVLREDSAGGGFYDFNNTWNNQTTFNENSLFDSLRNTKTAEIKVNINSHFPFSYILNKFLNPFSENKESFLKSIFILNFFIPLVFFLSLKNRYTNKNLYLIGCLASILFLSPYFRTSAYWAGMENYGIFMFVLSFYFFSNYEKKINIKLNIILFSLFSCLCVYFDQKLLIVPLVYLFLFFKNETNKINKIIYLLTNGILSIPVLSLIYYWGSIISPHDTAARSLGSRLFLEQIGYCLSIILFYLTPYIFIYYKKIIKYLLENKKSILILTIIFSFYVIFIIIFPTDYGKWWGSYGKGWLHKLSIMLFDENFYQKIFAYLFFYISVIAIFATAQRRHILIYFTFFFIIISSVVLYLDPLMLIFLTLFFYNEDEINDKFVKFHYFFNVLFLISLNLYY